MADRRIIASVVTHIEGVGNRLIYQKAPTAPRITPVPGVIPLFDFIYVATGSPLQIAWPELGGGVFDLEVRRLTYSTLQAQHSVSVETTLHHTIWTPMKTGLYAFRVRAAPGPWIDSMQSASGARGWIVQAYLAPVSGGGIR